jgi:hypothetical protein
MAEPTAEQIAIDRRRAAEKRASGRHGVIHSLQAIVQTCAQIGMLQTQAKVQAALTAASQEVAEMQDRDRDLPSDEA